MRKLAYVIGQLIRSFILFAAGAVGGCVIFTVANAAAILV